MDNWIWPSVLVFCLVNCFPYIRMEGTIKTASLKSNCVMSEGGRKFLLQCSPPCVALPQNVNCAPLDKVIFASTKTLNRFHAVILLSLAIYFLLSSTFIPASSKCIIQVNEFAMEMHRCTYPLDHDFCWSPEELRSRKDGDSGRDSYFHVEELHHTSRHRFWVCH